MSTNSLEKENDEVQTMIKKLENSLESYNENESERKKIELNEIRKRIILLKEETELDRKLVGALEIGDLDKVKYCIEHGANIHAWDDYPLRWAVYSGYFDIVVYLVELGADIHALNDEPLRWAAQFGYFDIVKCLVEHGADIHAQQDWSLQIAVRNGHFDIVIYLLDNGADGTKIKDSEVYKQWKKRKDAEANWNQVDLEDIPVSAKSDQGEAERASNLDLKDIQRSEKVSDQDESDRFKMLDLDEVWRRIKNVK
ncbi:ankyrin repeat domain-containing protein [Candidatus Pacearchaeota archaeon]|nr:ankyrin repeat domain-containing protein [Candidatus Pacearchaeota archaeon]